MVVMIVYVLLIAAIVLGLWRGGGPERIVAVVLIGMIAVDRVAHVLLAGYNPTSLDQFHLVIDLAGFAALVAVALSARRYWPLWASSCQLISVFTHLAWLLKTPLPMQVYLVLDIAPSALISCAVILGTVLHRRRLARHGTDLSWKSS